MDSSFVLVDSTVLQGSGEDIVAQAGWGEAIGLWKLAYLTMSTSDNAGFVLLRQVSWAVWHHFHPADPWRPARRRGS